MTYRLQLQYLGVLLFFLTLTSSQVIAQVFTGEKVNYQSHDLDSRFTSCEVFRIDAEPLANFVRSNVDANPTIVLGNHSWNVTLNTSDLLSPTYFRTIQTPTGNKISHKRPDIAFKGYVSTGGNVRLTLDKDFIYGYIQQNGELWRIEPLRYLEKGADSDLFVVYEKSDI